MVSRHAEEAVGVQREQWRRTEESSGFKAEEAVVDRQIER